MKIKIEQSFVLTAPFDTTWIRSRLYCSYYWHNV